MNAFDDASKLSTGETPPILATTEPPRTAAGVPAAGTSPEAGAPGAAGLTVAPATREEWHLVAEWAAEEGWNPGRGDVDCFHPTDPAGFFLGRLGGRPVSAVSVVTYSAEYAFLGYYLVHPDHRRRGLGLATWQAAVPHAGTRTIGLDAVPEQEATYWRSGFVPAYRTVRCVGRPGRVTAGRATPAVPVTPAHLDAIAAYDQGCFPAERRAFVARWLTAAGRVARVCVRDGRVTGYGAIRPARTGWRVGPVFADSAADAEALFDGLTAGLGPDEEVCVDVPEPESAALALVEARGLTPDSHTVRMYAGAAPGIPAAGRTYGVTSLELG
ncbi:GNAT family N-acetyltransferase [Streptomyces sp. NPDC018031]|uniref:GNAT family N-acetyltransferase n=1 Tax=Streptomyces sp. NPDC018031 TaxID=3365033 RepID=UPI0037BD6D3C